jgi:hypothetical protein
MCTCRDKDYKYSDYTHVRNCQNKWAKLNEWKCKHKSKCQNEWECQREYQCQHEWLKKYTIEELKKYQSKEEVFNQICEECNQWSSVSSFRLYMQQPEDTNVG